MYSSSAWTVIPHHRPNVISIHIAFHGYWDVPLMSSMWAICLRDWSLWQRPDVHHARALDLELDPARERIVMLAAATTRATVLTQSGKVCLHIPSGSLLPSFSFLHLARAFRIFIARELMDGSISWLAFLLSLGGHVGGRKRRVGSQPIRAPSSAIESSMRRLHFCIVAPSPSIDCTDFPFPLLLCRSIAIWHSSLVVYCIFFLLFSFSLNSRFREVSAISLISLTGKGA